MSMIQQSVLILLAGPFRLAVLAGILFLHLLEPSPVAAAEKALGVDLPRDIQVAHWEDSHGGFHGDGCAYGEFYTLRPGSFDPQAAGWQALPLSKDAETAFYGRTEEENGAVTTDVSPLPEGVAIPAVENGFWRFIDRQEGQSGSVFDRASRNFTAALWDSDNEVLYFLEIDT